jgi:hypothetical protein
MTRGGVWCCDPVPPGRPHGRRGKSCDAKEYAALLEMFFAAGLIRRGRVCH